MTNRNITGLSSLQTTNLTGNAADIQVQNNMNLLNNNLLNTNLLTLNQFSGLGVNPINVIITFHLFSLQILVY